MAQHMYGDLVNCVSSAVTFLFFFQEFLKLRPNPNHGNPMELHHQQPEQHRALPVLLTEKLVGGGGGPLLICTLQIAMGSCYFCSYRYQSFWASYAASALFAAFIAGILLLHWPLSIAESAPVTHYVWFLVTLCANVPNSVVANLSMGLVFATATMGAIRYGSPVHSLSENLPVFLVVSVAFAAFQVVRLVFFPTNVLKSKPMEPLVVAGSSSSSSNTVKVHWKKKLSYKNLPSWAGSFIIGSLFAVFLILELNSLMYQDGDSRLASYKFISTCIAGVVGLILVEAMNDESAKERARKRAKIVAEKNSSVAVATMALNISLAALVVVDKQRSIVMYNTAFQAEHGSHGETDMRGILLEDALSLSSGDTVELINCFEETSPRERDILINNRMVRVAFSNEPMDLVSSDSAHYFLTVFSVVTRHNIDIAPDNMVGHGPIPR